MKLKVQLLYLLFFLSLNSSFLFSQSVIFDDFENYDTQNPLCPQVEHWTTWSGNEGGAEDVPIVQPEPNSTNHAIPFQGHVNSPNGGPEDIILKLGDLTSGKHLVSFDMLIPNADGAYYNFQHFESPGIEWAFSVDISSGGIINGTTMAHVTVGGGELLFFTIQRGQWVKWEHYIDLDNDIISLVIDSFPVGEWTFSRQAGTAQLGTKQLGGINFFPLDWSYNFFIDNLNFENITPVSVSAPNVQPLQIYPNPSQNSIYFDLGKNNIDKLQSFEVIFYNQQGGIVKEVSSIKNKESIPIQELSSGTYFLKAVGESNSFYGKVIKQ